MSEVVQENRDAEYFAKVADSLAAAIPDRKSGFVTMRPSSRDCLVGDLRAAASLARHRIAAEAAAYEAAARVAEEFFVGSLAPDLHIYAQQIAAAIRALALDAGATGGEG